MTAGTGYRQGAVVLVPFPFTDQSGSKVRPALVVSCDSFNTNHFDVVLAAITSQIPPTLDPASDIPLDHADIASGKIKQASIIKISKLFTCQTDQIQRQVATVTSTKLGETIRALQALFS